MSTEPVKKLKAVRTNCVTGEAREVEVGAEVRPGSDGKPWLFLDGGPTGYESMPADKIPDAIARGGWRACVGTPGRWDDLLVTGEQLAQLAGGEK